MRKRVWSYNLRRISEVTGVPLETVRDHCRSGRFLPDNLLDVALYVVSQWVSRNRKSVSKVIKK